MKTELWRILRQLQRVSAGSAVVRLTAFGLAVAALAVAISGPLRDSPWTYLAIIGLAVVPAVRPGTPWTTAVEVIGVGAWLLSSVIYQEQRGVVAMLAVAALLYAHHTTCALAAALPLTAQLAPGVLIGWLARTGAAVAATVVLTVVAHVALPPTGTARSVAALPLLGLLAAVVAGGLIVFLFHRRR